ncbi:MAG: cation:proton antiporter [Armatimonadota bacterium]
MVSKLAGHLSRLVGQPVVFGEILAGLLLGPTLANIFSWPMFLGSPVVGSGQGAQPLLQVEIQSLATIGVLLLMFVAGLETDLVRMRQVGKSAFWTALFGMLLPLIAGTLVARAFGLTLTESFFIGTVLTATSVSISAQTLLEMGQFRSKEGTTIMGAAVIDDVLGIIVLSFVIAFGTAHTLAADTAAHTGLAHMASSTLASILPAVGSAALWHVFVTIVFMGLFFLVATFIGARWFGKILEYAERLHASHAIPAAALLLLLVFAFSAEYIGQVAAITGAYIAGVYLGCTRFRHQVEHGILPITYAFFVPIFFTSIGLNANARSLGAGSIFFTVVIILLAIATKIVGCSIGARITNFSWRESLRVGIGMISRGEVGIIVAGVGLTAGIIHGPVYAAMILMVLATTVLTPVLLRLAFPRKAQEEEDVFESVVALETEEEEKELYE